MALSEHQILRYSRQILLAEVGGVGQERWLGRSARLAGTGCAGATAAAYLGAGGTPLSMKSDLPGRGYLFPDARSALLDLNPDALGEGQGGEAPEVALGWRGGRGLVVYRSLGGCGACFEATVGSVQPEPVESSSAGEVLLGALGAVAHQRMALGISEPLGAIEVDADGRFRATAFIPCGAHR